MSLLRKTLAIMLLSTAASAGPVEKAGNAVDPDCTPAKAATGAATRATVGVGNRCGVGETARDMAGVDGKGVKSQDRGDTGPLKKPKN